VYVVGKKKEPDAAGKEEELSMLLLGRKKGSGVGGVAVQEGRILRASKPTLPLPIWEGKGIIPQCLRKIKRESNGCRLFQGGEGRILCIVGERKLKTGNRKGEGSNEKIFGLIPQRKTGDAWCFAEKKDTTPSILVTVREKGKKMYCSRTAGKGMRTCG